MTVVTREEELVGSEKGIEPYSATEVKVENGRFINWNQPITGSSCLSITPPNRIWWRRSNPPRVSFTVSFSFR